jgi:hypothetical protein
MIQKNDPNIAKWVEHGWIEVGDSSDWAKGSFVRAFDIGVMLFEGQDGYDSPEAAFEDFDAGIAAWFEENGNP